MYSIEGTTLIGVTKGTDGLWLEVTAPTASMTLDTTASRYAIGSVVTNVADGKKYTNTGTVAAPVWSQTNSSAVADVQLMKFVEVDLTPAQIIATTAGSLSHASGLTVVPAAPTGYVNVLHRAIVSLTYGTAAYTGGGNNTFNIAGGAAITGLIATTTLWQNASSIIQEFVPLSTVAFPITKETAINLVTASAVTNPGTAAGTAKVYAWYSQVAI